MNNNYNTRKQQEQLERALNIGSNEQLLPLPSSQVSKTATVANPSNINMGMQKSTPTSATVATSFSSSSCTSNGGLFPEKLHDLLEYADERRYQYGHIISWYENGTSFLVFNKDLLVNEVLPLFFGQTQYKSFERQLNMWYFDRLLLKRSIAVQQKHYVATSNTDNDIFDNDIDETPILCFKHPYFIRGQKALITKHSLGRSSFKRKPTRQNQARRSSASSSKAKRNKLMPGANSKTIASPNLASGVPSTMVGNFYSRQMTDFMKQHSQHQPRVSVQLQLYQQQQRRRSSAASSINSSDASLSSSSSSSSLCNTPLSPSTSERSNRLLQLYEQQSILHKKQLETLSPRPIRTSTSPQLAGAAAAATTTTNIMLSSFLPPKKQQHQVYHSKPGSCNNLSTRSLAPSTCVAAAAVAATTSATNTTSNRTTSSSTTTTAGGGGVAQANSLSSLQRHQEQLMMQLLNMQNAHLTNPIILNDDDGGHMLNPIVDDSIFDYVDNNEETTTSTPSATTGAVGSTALLLSPSEESKLSSLRTMVSAADTTSNEPIPMDDNDVNLVDMFDGFQFPF